MGGRGAGGAGGGGRGGSSKQPVTRASTLAKEETAIRGNNFETGVVVDANGKVLVRNTGTGSEVRFSKADTAVMKGNTMTHNHPEGSTFSPADIDLATKHGLSEIRAVSTNKTFVLTKTANKRIAKSFSTDYKDAMRREANRLSLDIMSDKAFNTKMNAFRSSWLSNNASKYGYSYSEG